MTESTIVVMCKYERSHVQREVVGVGAVLPQWVPRIELRLSGLLDKCFQVHLTGPFRHSELPLIGHVLPVYLYLVTRLLRLFP